MFDDHAGRRLELLDAFERGVRVRDVVIGEGLALDLFGCGQRPRRRSLVTVEGRGLVGILAVTQPLAQPTGIQESLPERLLAQ